MKTARSLRPVACQHTDEEVYEMRQLFWEGWRSRDICVAYGVRLLPQSVNRRYLSVPSRFYALVYGESYAWVPMPPIGRQADGSAA